MSRDDGVGGEGPALEADAADAVFDPGLQPERTLLAWRRTCLAFGVASLVGMRFTVEHLGFLAILGGLLGAALAVLAYALTAVGYRRAHRTLRAEGMLARGGWPMLAAMLAVLVIGGLCTVVLVVRETGG